MPEIAAIGRDTWMRLQRNPLLLLVIVLGLAGLGEGAARVIPELQDEVISARLGYFKTVISVTAVDLVVATVIYFLSSVGALVVVLNDQSFFGPRSDLALARYFARSAFAFLLIAIAQVAFGFFLGFLVGRFRPDVFSVSFLVLHCGWTIALAAAKAFLVSLLLPALVATASHPLSKGTRDPYRQRHLSVSSFAVFLASGLVGIAILHAIHGYSTRVGGYRTNLIASAIEMLLVVILAFVVRQHASTAHDPTAATVFD